MKDIFKPGRMLIPNKDVDYTKWSVVACDQYTSEPDYWNEVVRLTQGCPTTLNITLPEIYLEDDGVNERIEKINATMKNYLDQGVFREVDGYILLEREQADKKIRRGLVGVCDLEQYDFSPDSQSPIRATEGTILDRIPPRLAVRKDAPLETPHIMMLIDDPEMTVIEKVAAEKESFEKLYDFELMMNGGRSAGYLVSEKSAAKIGDALERLADKGRFESHYGVTGKGVLPFAVGDGNHSLATAKTSYENLKKQLPAGDPRLELARWALIEVVNIHDAALEFEPIHRVLFDVDAKHLIDQFKKTFDTSCDGGGQRIEYMYAGGGEVLYVKNPSSNIAVGTLQGFLDAYMKAHGGRIDYIHGDSVTKELGTQPGNIGFILPTLGKGELFKTVIVDSALPRKTFSMGHANDKRFYLECRKIK